MEVKFRLTIPRLLIVVLLIFLYFLAPVIYLTWIGFSNDLSLSSAMKHHWFPPPAGEMIDESSVSTIYPQVHWAGVIAPAELDECSGLAVSRSNPGMLWGHNDSGGKSRLYAMNTKGEDLGHVDINIPEMGDWEDMAAFQYQGKSYLVVGDVGDNYRWRPVLKLTVIEEPELTVEAQTKEIQVAPAWEVIFRYPDGFYDVESIAVSEEDEAIYLLTKRRLPHRLYRLPLKPDTPEVVAEFVAEVSTLPQPNEADLRADPKYGKYRSQPTGMDISGDDLVVVTYKDAYWFKRQGSWGESLQKPPTRIRLPEVMGREAIAITPTSKKLYVGAERIGSSQAHLWQVSLDSNGNQEDQ